MKLAAAAVILIAAMGGTAGTVYALHLDVLGGMMAGIICGVAAAPLCCYLLEDYL